MIPPAEFLREDNTPVRSISLQAIIQHYPAATNIFLQTYDARWFPSPALSPHPTQPDRLHPWPSVPRILLASLSWPPFGVLLYLSLLLSELCTSTLGDGGDRAILTVVDCAQNFVTDSPLLGVFWLKRTKKKQVHQPQGA